MAAIAKKNNVTPATNRRGYWQQEIERSNKRYQKFNDDGKVVVDRYRLERTASNNSNANDLYRDRYNILYSTTETTKPSLYAQTPKVQATKRHPDRENDTVNNAVMLLETVGQYALEDIDFDEVMNNVVEDYLLPGMGVAWVRYVPTIKSSNDNADDGYTDVFDGLDIEYVHYRDFRTGVCRVWKENPWVARRVYFTKEQATKRWGAEVANRLSYSHRISESGDDRARSSDDGSGDQAIIWEIWDKQNRKVIWYSDDYSPDVIEQIDDPLNLQNFFPCPRPIRAVSNTRTFIPKAFYAEYKAQAEELDNLTEKIRYLTQALRAIGVYDGSQEILGQLLLGQGNKMVAVQNWAQFASTGGIAGAIQWVPITEVSTVLTELFRQREIVKNEIYEITGFSDIQRGVSKASETLGAQQIKNDWAGGRLRNLQKEVQRFCRDIIRIVVEIISEQFDEASIAQYAGFDPPPVTDEEQAAAAQYAHAMMAYQQQQQMLPQPGMPPAAPPQKPPPTARQLAINQFIEVVKLIKSEKTRCANIGIETDSTIQPDESAEREDRMQFLSSVGAFLQQAGPMALQYPDMRGLLGAILMFTVRTFRASRPIEAEFEKFSKALESAPPMPPPGSQSGPDKETVQVQTQADMQKEQLKSQTVTTTTQMTTQAQKYEVDAKTATENQRMQLDHAYRMSQLELEKAKVSLEAQKLAIEQARVGQEHQDAAVATAKAIAENTRADDQQQHDQTMDIQDGDRQDEQLEQQQNQFDASRADAQNAPKNDA